MKKNTGIIRSIAMLLKSTASVASFSTYLKNTGKAPEIQKGWKQLLVLGENFEETEENKFNVYMVAYDTKTEPSMRSANKLLKDIAAYIDEFIIGNRMRNSGYEDLIRQRPHRAVSFR